MLHDMANGASEQSAGVSHAGQAIDALDDMTQQNSALAEQAAFIAVQLQAQAESLSVHVQRFRLA
jgi:methyl-accepting chemotaxis protein